MSWSKTGVIPSWMGILTIRYNGCELLSHYETNHSTLSIFRSSALAPVFRAASIPSFRGQVHDSPGSFGPKVANIIIFHHISRIFCGHYSSPIHYIYIYIYWLKFTVVKNHWFIKSNPWPTSIINSLSCPPAPIPALVDWPGWSHKARIGMVCWST